MRRILLLTALISSALVSCVREPDCGPAEVSACVITLTGLRAEASEVTKASPEDSVKSIRVYVFNGNSLDGYDTATPDELAAGTVSVDCTRGLRDIWVVVNGPESLSSVTTRAGLKEAVSHLCEDNSSGAFVMVGRSEALTLGATFSGSIGVGRIVSRVRLFRIRRELKAEEFSIRRIYTTCVAGNACYDVFTPTFPSSREYLMAPWGGNSAMIADEGFLYREFEPPVSLADGESCGTDLTFYVYPNEYAGADAPLSRDQTKLVVECIVDGRYYTYPVPLGRIGSNKSYDINMLTITRLGNDSNGDDVVDPEEDVVISVAPATFALSVNDWYEITRIGGAEDGNLTI